MKKTLTFILALSILTFAGCGEVKNNISSSQTDTSSSEIVTSAEESSSKTEITSEPKVSSKKTSSVTNSNANSSKIPTSSKTKTFSEAEINSSSVIESSSEIISSVEGTSSEMSSVINNDISNQTTNKKYVQHTWEKDPATGEKIQGSDQYVDCEGNVYDINGNYLYNLSEWGIHYYTYEK